MSFLEELKRRNVFRVGAAYAVAAWVALQLLDVVGEILELPAWGGKLILAVIVIGFFVAVVVAWAYELTPEGVKREKDVDRSQSISNQTGRRLNAVIIGLMAVAIAYLLFDKFYLAPRLASTGSDEDQVQAAPSAAPVPPGTGETEPAVISSQSIAVLPFDNRSRREEDEFFVEGIHDDLLTTLARIGSLKVISRTSVNKYRDTDKSLPEIAGELGVATVMEGAVQRSGNTVRINVQLIDAQTDEHLWAEIFDRELTADNLFAIQSEISSEIARALEATLSPEEQARINERPTDNLAAYNAYLRGRQLLTRRNSESVDQAFEEFERATELDPAFALAWVGISEAANLRSTYSDLAMAESIELSRAATDRALALDDQLGEAHIGRALVAEHYGRLEEAEAAYLRALELSPGYASAWQWYGNLLSRYPHRLDEGVQKLQKALELDPLSSIIRRNLADRYRQMGRFDEALAELGRLEQLDPEFVPLFSSRSGIEAEQGRLADRVRSMQRSLEMDPGNIGSYIDLMWAYFDLDYLEPLASIRQRMADINEQHPGIGIVDMVSSVYEGNYDGALETARWTWERLGRPPFFNRIMGYINLMKGDYPAARVAFEAAEPRYFQRETWRQAIEQEANDACLVGLLLQRTGDPELGKDLLLMTLDYLENELPRYIEHADRFTVEDCYIALGRTGDALAAIETRLDHRHYEGWWWYERGAHFQALWSEPRFKAAMQRVKNEVAAQRTELVRSDTAAL
ncbi:MAG: tetratricopeptide repeat protein [Gammaproteobacteria bacterium]|nr:tetratricopeptide repeat protein [Gammaproteobacteria bacterium]